MDHESRVVFITGAGQGIGEACAHHFARSGDRLVLCARRDDGISRLANLLTADGTSVLAKVCDVSDSAQVDSLVESALNRFGRIDVLIANAGIALSAPLVRTSDAQWEQVMKVNAGGVFYCLRSVLPCMLARKSGRIIAIASTASKVGYRYTSAYCASKHAVIGLVRSAALETASSGITVNAICPGFVDTPMTQHTVATIAGKSKLNVEDAHSYLQNLNPQGRLVTPDEVAALAVFLASPSAAGINGQAIPLDGGSVQS